MKIVHARRARRRTHTIGERISALIVCVAFALVGQVAAPAQAATLGGMISFGGFHVGGFQSSNGEFVYCLEPGAETPFSPQQAPRRVNELRGYSLQTSDEWGWDGRVSTVPARGDLLRAINWVIFEHGQTTDPDRMADVQIALWELRKEPGNAAWVDQKFAYIRSYGGEQYVDRGIALAAEALRSATGPSGIDPSGDLELRQGDRHGTGVVTYPAGTTEIRLEGATFADGSATLKLTGTAASRAGEAAWSAKPHERAWQRAHEVSATGDWAYSETFWPTAVILHPPTFDVEQSLGAGVSPVTETRSGELTAVTHTVDGRFVPVVTTAVPERFLERGIGAFSDTVTIDAAAGSPWPTRESTGEAMPVVAHGVLYGPFLSPQAEADEPPAGAPIAARSHIDAQHGPGTYAVQTDVTAREAGYYYWVWTIDEQEQPAHVRESELLAPGGVYSDRFGVHAESQVVATTLEWETQLASNELTLDDRVLRDSVRVQLREGGWLHSDDGARIPARIRLTVFQEDQEPVRAEHAPAAANVLGTTTVDVSEPAVWIEAEPFEVPFGTRGWVTVQACLSEADQDEAARGYFAEWCDDYGMPAETAEIVLPRVRTEAVPSVTVGEPIWDRAFVTGSVPEGAEISFTYYLEPEAGAPKYSSEWTPRRDAKGTQLTWSAAELQAMDKAELCLAQPVAVLQPAALREPGEIQSALVTARTIGTGYWVERVTVRHPETDEAVLIHEGECGIDNERTVISAPQEESLADTGASYTPGLLSGMIALVALGIGAVCIARARTRR